VAGQQLASQEELSSMKFVSLHQPRYSVELRVSREGEQTCGSGRRKPGNRERTQPRGDSAVVRVGRLVNSRGKSAVEESNLDLELLLVRDTLIVAVTFI
jgi:hypothetical protein